MHWITSRLFLYGSTVLSLVLISVVVFCPATADALSLEQARRAALEANLDIKIAAEKLIETESLSKERYSALFFRVDAIGDLTHMNKERKVDIGRGEYGTYGATGPLPSSNISIAAGERDTYEARLRLTQPVFTGGRLYYSYRSAQATKSASRWDRQMSQEDILFKTERAYISVLQAQELNKFAEDHKRNIKAHLHDMELKYKQGRAALNELLKVKVEMARAKEEVIKAKNELLSTRGELNTILNRPYEQAIEVSLVGAPAELELSLKDAEARALLNRPDIKSMRALKKGALFDRRVAQSGYYPDFKVVAEYTRQTDEPVVEPENWSAMLYMEYPLWQWGKIRHKVNAASAVERQNQYRIASLRRQVSADVRQAWFKVREADERIDVTEEGLEQARENLRITKYGFEHGARTSAALLDAEAVLSRANFEHTKAKYYAHFTRAVLRYASGIMLGKAGEEPTEVLDQVSGR
ncbi:hypothetical protein MNBD_DELTA02-921 [hydrothermal vent metagenome]|uniref:Outer membrane efflux protein n=1 Tax=hydrothermal vent metagenome TaxID=652676 RepID=A0A3B0VLI2_9ZZZZ